MIVVSGDGMTCLLTSHLEHCTPAPSRLVKIMELSPELAFGGTPQSKIIMQHVSPSFLIIHPSLEGAYGVNMWPSDGEFYYVSPDL